MGIKNRRVEGMHHRWQTTFGWVINNLYDINVVR